MTSYFRGVSCNVSSFTSELESSLFLLVSLANNLFVFKKSVLSFTDLFNCLFSLLFHIFSLPTPHPVAKGDLENVPFKSTGNTRE